MAVFDYKKELKHLYFPKGKLPVVVTVPAMRYLMIDGHGDPNNQDVFAPRVEALYGISYTLKFMLKKRSGLPEYGVPPLEGLWWMDDMEQFITVGKEEWLWTLMIMQPPFITEGHITEAIAAFTAKKKLPEPPAVRFKEYVEGECAQVLYTGPYKDEGPVIQELHRFIAANGGTLSGKHHEIYLGDPRKSAPEKLKTVIRQPFRR